MLYCNLLYWLNSKIQIKQSAVRQSGQSGRTVRSLDIITRIACELTAQKPPNSAEPSLLQLLVPRFPTIPSFPPPSPSWTPVTITATVTATTATTATSVTLPCLHLRPLLHPPPHPPRPRRHHPPNHHQQPPPAAEPTQSAAVLSAERKRHDASFPTSLSLPPRYPFSPTRHATDARSSPLTASSGTAIASASQRFTPSIPTQLILCPPLPLPPPPPPRPQPQTYPPLSSSLPMLLPESLLTHPAQMPRLHSPRSSSSTRFETLSPPL